MIEAVVDETGHVSQASIKVASPDPEFDRRALDQVKAWKREPALYKGKPVPVFLSASVCPHPSP